MWIGIIQKPAIAGQRSLANTADGDWPDYNRGARSSRYSPLDQITATNVYRLQLAWTFTPQRDDSPAGPGERGGPGVGNSVVPVVVDGVMHVSAENLVLALDGDTGEEI